MDLALQLATECNDYGDGWSASKMELVAAELLLELGEVSRAKALVDTAWQLLGHPQDAGVLTSIVAAAHAVSGDLAGALRLLDEAIVNAPSASEAAVLDGDAGIVLARGGRRFEAIVRLGRVLANESLPPEAEAVFRDPVAGASRSMEHLFPTRLTFAVGVSMGGTPP